MGEIAILLTLLSIALTNSIQGKIDRQFRPYHSDKLFKIEYSSLTILVDDEMEFMIPQNGEFEINDLSIGMHTLRILSKDYYFEPVAVNIKEHETKAYILNPKGTTGKALVYPLVLDASETNNHFDIEEPNPMLSIMKSPMFMMIAVVVLIQRLIPKDKLRETQEMMKNLKVPTNLNGQS